MKPIATLAVTVILICAAVPAFAQAKPAAPAATTAQQKPAAPAPAARTTTPADYVIGAGDVLTIVYWRDKDMSGEYTVRPDGKITLPLINDVEAVGLTPEQLRDRLTQLSSKQFVDPTISVDVKTINSRQVFITGGVKKPAPYNLLIPMTVIQLISVAGGLNEFVDGKNILVVRTEGGKTQFFKFNYKDFISGKNPEQNIQLRPGDTVTVPE